MPGRDIPLVTERIYHVLNRGIASQSVFSAKTDYQRLSEAIFYYQNQNPFLSYSRFLRLPTKERAEFLQELRAKAKFLVEVVALCLMSNHFHLLLKQAKDGGTSLFMSKLTNSFTRYFNTKNERIGPLFQGKFKAILIETDEQLLHVSRYIHLNPYSSYLVKTPKDLEVYPYSSLPEYLGNLKTDFFQKGFVLNQFKSTISYKEFVFDQADYQRKLDQIKHLALE
jgi:putative transposase